MYLRCFKSARRLDKIFLLWILFVVQLSFIGLFVWFGSLSNNNNDLDNQIDDGERPIRFVGEVKRGKSAATTGSVTSADLRPIFTRPPLGDFHREFIECNGSGFYCYRNGSVVSTNVEDNECSCLCQPEYHRKDCGQPEVFWRAFMTARPSRNANELPEGDRRRPRRIIYLIHATALSLNTVEMQFLELNGLVDLLVLCDAPVNATHQDLSFKYHQTSYQHHGKFFLKQFQAKILILKASTGGGCSPKAMYQMFRSHIEANDRNVSFPLKDDDVLVFSHADEILNRRAVKYLKWYNNWTQSQPIRFRLKHTVYGFFWQHPNTTRLSSGACQLCVLDELFKGDPEQMLLASEDGMIIGDLNHLGGWYCQYCHESALDIVRSLQFDRRLKLFDEPKEGKRLRAVNQVENPPKKPSIIDSSYIQSLISAGVFVDGKLPLIRLHRFSDKYYAPDSVIDRSWKYESFLSNTYAHYDTDGDEEDLV